MARKPRTESGKVKKQEALHAALRDHVRAKAKDYLRDPNITSVGVGLKNGDGPVSLQFTVDKKASGLELEALDTVPLPTAVTLPDGTVVPTDVLERSYRPSFEVVEAETVDERKVRRDPIQPGISIGQSKSGGAGTIGMIVFDGATGAPCILSNWHVLHGNGAAVGDDVVQPGRYDDNASSGNYAGKLLRSHLGDAGDCALARIEKRSYRREVYGFDVVPRQMARVQLGDLLMKSGRTTGITHGVVRRVDVVAKINYRGSTGEQAIGGFEIGVDPDRRPHDGEISKGGDSGSIWLVARDGVASDIFAGLHFAGETDANADEHALACYPLSVQKKLGFNLDPPATAMVGEAAETAVPRTGYRADFLAERVALPGLSDEQRGDTVEVAGSAIIPYTHFSLCLSASRRMARFVAWNIDGAHLASLPRRGFQLDPRVPAKYQLGDDIYRNNKLDKGHIARRADVVWGPLPEAEQANRDSNFYTNIAPQHERYNQSSRKGLWGRLEDLLFAQVDVKDVRISVMAGPTFGENDIEHRGATVPAGYWKLIAYVGHDDRLRAAAYILSQADLLTDIESIDLDPFRLYQVSIAELSRRTGLRFEGLDRADLLLNEDLATPALAIESLAAPSDQISEVRSPADIRF